MFSHRPGPAQHLDTDPRTQPRSPPLPSPLKRDSLPPPSRRIWKSHQGVRTAGGRPAEYTGRGIRRGSEVRSRRPERESTFAALAFRLVHGSPAQRKQVNSSQRRSQGKSRRMTPDVTTQEATRFPDADFPRKRPNPDRKHQRKYRLRIKTRGIRHKTQIGPAREHTQIRPGRDDTLKSRGPGPGGTGPVHSSRRTEFIEYSIVSDRVTPVRLYCQRKTEEK